MEAIVLLAPLVGDGLWQALSDGGGAFRIEGVPPGAYRLSVRSLGHVPIELGRVEVPAESGLSLRLVLVGYPLSFITEAGVRPVPEQPRPWVPAQMAPAPEPEPDPLVPGPPEEASTAPPES